MALPRLWLHDMPLTPDHSLSFSDGDEFIIFSGGMARGSYGDKYTVSVIQGQKHVTFDFTSRVLDYLVLTLADEESRQHSGEETTPLVSDYCFSIASWIHMNSSW